MLNASHAATEDSKATDFVASSPLIGQRFQSLIWTCLDLELARSALFYAERYYALDMDNHDARHLYATALLRSRRPHSALKVVSDPEQTRCNGCLEIRAECYSALGRHRQAREALEARLQDSGDLLSSTMSSRTMRAFSEEAALRCRAGILAMKGNMPEKATSSFSQALSLAPMLWEAFEGLCSLGTAPEVDEIFPPKPIPTRRTAPEEPPPIKAQPGPTATATGPFVPDAGQNNLLRARKNVPQPFRMELSDGPRDPFHESGPVQKRLRPTTRQRSIEATKTKTSKAIVDEALKKARARPALTFANIFSSPSCRSQPVQNSKTTIGTGKNERNLGNAVLGPRRSTRLLSGTSNKASGKHPPVRERRRQLTTSRSRSVETDLDGRCYCPRCRGCILQLTTFRATRALSVYDCYTCLAEIGQMPPVHQQSSWVLAMAGRAYYERLEYASAERAFRAARDLEPYRLDDMEVYSTLLWHLQRNVHLSYLAQELMNIDACSPQAWIASGNLFSLQKERSQALTYVDKAISFFQRALRADPRHYNAWYGLGTCYLRMSKIRLAEYHYRKALEIHPRNAVLLGCVGMTVERRDDKAAAHSLFDQAVRVAPDNALVRYRRAKILISMKRYKDAAEDLHKLRDSSPEESNVVFQLAKVYRLMGDEVKSAQWLAIARDMSPKSVNKLKKLIETVKADEGGDDRMDEG
ncbi:TPR-like protein [Pisolithus thermaeus]|nr:TPR-like protein [Pisolithus thermaeus]